MEAFFVIPIVSKPARAISVDLHEIDYYDSIKAARDRLTKKLFNPSMSPSLNRINRRNRLRRA